MSPEGRAVMAVHAPQKVWREPPGRRSVFNAQATLRGLTSLNPAECKILLETTSACFFPLTLNAALPEMN